VREVADRYDVHRDFTDLSCRICRRRASMREHRRKEAGMLTSVLAWRRQHLDRELAQHRIDFVRGHEPKLRNIAPPGDVVDAFARASVSRVTDFLDLDSLERLRDEALAVSSKKTRSYVPTHKKGGTVSYEELHRSCPGCLAFYHSPTVQTWVSAVVGMKVGPAGDHDQSANSILFYDEPGDHIHWHYDHNFYKGRQFTCLLNLVNRGPAVLSASHLVYRDTAGKDVEVDTRENSFVVFEGARVRHKATPTVAGDLRVMLSMTFNTDPRISYLGEALRRIKDTAFFGVRVLWR
jgi:hypothetical protein